MPRATATFSVDDVLQTSDPHGTLTLIVAGALFDGDEQPVPVDARYNLPTVPISQYYMEETGIGATDADSLPTLYDIGFKPEDVLRGVLDGSFDKETYQWGDGLTITAEARGNNRIKLTLELQTQ